MPTNSPITINLYDENDEPRHFQKSIIAWGILKEAVKFAKKYDLDHLDLTKIDDEIFDQMAAIVCAAFGDQFTVEDLNKNCSIEEVTAVLQNIFARTEQIGNPTKPGR